MLSIFSSLLGRKKTLLQIRQLDKNDSFRRTQCYPAREQGWITLSSTTGLSSTLCAAVLRIESEVFQELS